MAEGFDLSKLAAEFGAYHRQYSHQIEEKLRFGNETSKYMNVLDGTIDQKAMAKGEMSEVSQAYSSKVTYKGQYKATPNIITTDDVMLAYRFIPKELRKEWLGFLVQERLTQRQLPFINYMMSKALKQFIHEHETQHVGRAFRKEPVEGVAGAAINAMTGYLVRLYQKFAKGGIVPMTNGYFNKDTIAEYVAAQLPNIPFLYRHSPDLMCVMSLDNLTHYKNATNQANNINFVYQIGPNFNAANAKLPELPQGQAKVAGTQIPVVGLPSMGDSNLIMFVEKRNFKKLVDKDSLQFEPIQYDDFYVKVLGSMNAGVGFTWDELVWVCGSLSETPIVQSITDVTASAITLNWETAWGSTGYEVDISTDSTFTGVTTTAIAGMETNTKIITGLSANTDYYVRQRSIIQRESSTDKYHSFDSKIKVVRTLAA